MNSNYEIIGQRQVLFPDGEMKNVLIFKNWCNALSGVYLVNKQLMLLYIDPCKDDTYRALPRFIDMPVQKSIMEFLAVELISRLES